MKKQERTFDECRAIILQCHSCAELQKRAFSVYRKAFGKWPELQQYFSWKRKPHYTPEQKQQQAEEKEQRRAERELRKAARKAEQQERSRKYQERLAEQAIVRQQREEEKAQRKAQREAESAERRAERESQRKVEREQKHRITIQKQRDYLQGKGHLASPKKVKWTEERVREALLECGDMQTLRKKYRRAFNLVYTRFRQLLELLPNHISSGYQNPDRESWTKEECRRMASQYASVKEERDQNPALYHWIARRGWLRYCHQDIMGKKVRADEVAMHGLTRDLIMQYDDEEQFKREHPFEYQYAMGVKTLREEIMAHFPAVYRRRIHDASSLRTWQESQPGYRTMLATGETFRCIYACEFPDHHAYVGLTADPHKRSKEHGWISNVGESQAASHKYETGQDFEFKVLTEFLPDIEASIAEGEWKRRYATDGWTILNVAPTGSLGGSGVACLKQE